MSYVFFGSLATALSTWLYCEYLFPRKVSIGVALTSFCLCYIALIGAMMSHFGWLFIVPFFGVSFFLLWKNYDCAPRTAVLHAAYLSFAMLLSEALAGFAMGDPQLPFSLPTAQSLSAKLCFMVFCLLGARLFTPHKQNDPEPSMMLLFCAPPVISAGAVLAAMFLGASQSLPPQAEIMVVLCELALLAVDLIFFVLYNRLQKAHAEKLELELSIQKERSDTDHYRLLREQAQQQQILIHDIRNHLRALDELAAGEQSTKIRDYIAALETTLKPAGQQRLCADPILDMLLQRIRQDCLKRHIHFDCDIRPDVTGFMDEPSITALYGNLLSNALEGADRSSGRTISLRVTRNPEQGVTIGIVNDCDHPPSTDRFGRLISHKSDPQSHGVGLKSIERIVGRYGGIQTMYYEEETRRFHHVIHFPR